MAKLGPSLLIGSCLILAIRTARWEARQPGTASDRALDTEVDYAIYVAGRVLSKLLAHKSSMFPTKPGPTAVECESPE